MNTELFLQNLRDLPLEEGKVYIQGHIDELSDHAAFGKLLEDEALRLLYTPFASLKIAELLIFFGRYVQHTLSHALGLKAKGDALMMIGHHQAAIDALDIAGQEFKVLGDEGNWARSRISWIMSGAWLGRVEEALREGARARDVFLRLGEYYWVCAIDHNVALIYDFTGQYQDALKLYEKMRAIYPTLIDQNDNAIKQRVALAEMNQALDLASLGNFEESYRLQQQAQASFIALKETSCVISTEINLADLDYLQGYYGSALRRYYQALDSLKQSNIDEPLQMPELKFCIANCLVKLNRVQEACQLAYEAVELYRRAGISLNTGNALREYATTLAASGKLREALTALDEAWMLLSRGSFDPLAFATKYQQAQLLLEMGSATAAYDQAKIAQEYFKAKGLVTLSLRANLVMASALLQNAWQAVAHQEKGQRSKLIQEALLLCEQTASQAHRHNLQEVVYKSHYLLGQFFAFQENPAKAASYYESAITQIEHMLGDLVYDLSPSFLQNTWAVYEDMIALCLQQAQPGRALNYLEQARSMALRQYLNKSRTPLSGKLEQEDTSSTSVLQQNNAAILRTQYELRNEQEQHRKYSVLLADIDCSVSPSVDQEVIQQELKRHEEKVSELFERLHLYQSSIGLFSQHTRHKTHKVKQVDVARLRQRLSPNQILLEYFLYRGKLIIFAATTERLVARELPDGGEQLERLLPLLHAHLDPRGWSDFQKPPEQVVLRLLNRLYNLLVAPVSELLPSSSGHLTIVPYGPLHKLPFHALHDGTRYLIENFQINYLPASSILMHLEPQGDGHYARSIGRSASSTRPPLIMGYSENGQLQRVHNEATIVASLLNGECYLEHEATITRLIERAYGSPVIHLATHGRSRLDAPNFSYVRLADGQLNAIDAFSMDLKACELVTLSGCETGLALSGGGDEQLGLGRAFLAAGAASLVISLWPVEDDATNQLMQLLYRNLLKGESKVQSLRAAQCQLLQSTSSDYTHPYFWAAFRLVGDVGPLKSQRAKDLSFASKTVSLKK